MQKKSIPRRLSGLFSDENPVRVFWRQRKFFRRERNAAISGKEIDNILRWNGERGFYEVYYLKFNDSASRTAYWIRYTMNSPLPHVGEPYCEVWGIFFDIENPDKNFAVKNRFPVDKLEWDTDRFRVSIEEAEITMNACRGTVADKKTGHSLSWNLTFDSPGNTMCHYPSTWYYIGPIPRVKALSPHVDARFNGTINANGRNIPIADAPGEQTHSWGSKHATRWAWGHCNSFKEEPDALWEGTDGQITLGGIKSPHVTRFYMKTGGREYILNNLLGSFRNTSEWKLGHWSFSFQNREIMVRGEIKCRIEDIIGVTYMDPDGENLWCYNTEVASIKLDLFTPGGAKIRELNSRHGCAVEFVDRKTYPEAALKL